MAWYCIVFDIIAVYCMSPHCILWYGMVLYFIWSNCTVSHCYVPLLQRAGELPRRASSHFFIYSFMHISYQKSCGLWMVNLEPKSPIFTTPSCYLACAFVTLLGGPWSTSKNSMLTFVDPFTDRIWPSGFKCSGLAGGNENLR